MATKLSLIPLIALCLTAGTAAADSFDCVEAGSCTDALKASNTCSEGEDYHITHTDRGSDVTVLAIHGGSIEANTSAIAETMASSYGFNAYTFNGHGTSDCLDGLSNHGRLHVTATHFDEAQAMDMVDDAQEVVTIHGYSADRGYPAGVICVGGSNAAQRAEFIAYVNQYASVFTLYALQPIDAPTSQGMCSDLAGTATANIVNLGQDPNGGLQLELSPQMRGDLVKSGTQYTRLRRVIGSGVWSATLE